MLVSSGKNPMFVFSGNYCIAFPFLPCEMCSLKDNPTRANMSLCSQVYKNCRCLHGSSPLVKWKMDFCNTRTEPISQVAQPQEEFFPSSFLSCQPTILDVILGTSQMLMSIISTSKLLTFYFFWFSSLVSFFKNNQNGSHYIVHI